MNHTKIRIGLFGAGYFGELHAKNLIDTPFHVVGYFDPNISEGKAFGGKFQVNRFHSAEELIREVDAVDIVATTSSHIEIAQLALHQDKHIFIEKPIAVSAVEAENFIKSANQKKLVVQVGHIERFNPAFQSGAKLVDDAKFIQAFRLAPYNPRANDVSVVHDLMIHDIDAILSMIKSRVEKIEASGISVLTDHLDFCEARIEFQNGCVANLQASRMDAEHKRSMDIQQKRSRVSIDFLHKGCSYMYFDDKPGDSGEHWQTPGGNLYMKKNIINFSSSNAILEELKEFYNSIANGEPIRVSHNDAFQALSIADKVNFLAGS